MLTIENLHVAYGAVKALNGVSLSIHEGEIVTLIGNNGAGKTTLVRTLSGLIKRQSGSILFEDADLTHLQAHQIVERGIVHVPEGRMIFQNMTVHENLQLGAYISRGKKQDKTLEEVFFLFPRLKERAKQNAGTLSGGEQQMLAIGRALMARPRLLILDEPSLGLAPNLVQQIFKTLKEIHKQGMTILLIEQDAFLALKTANRGYVIETGEIRISGPNTQLLDNPDVQKAYLGMN
jgi:branched-chain amino acid transport system ATP-binding protein